MNRKAELVSIAASFSRFTKLRPDPAGFDRHHDRLHRADLLIGHPFFLGHAKIVFHSRVAGHRHGGGEMDHQSRFLIEDFVVSGRFVELSKRLVLFFRKHWDLLSVVLFRDTKFNLDEFANLIGRQPWVD